LKQVKVYGNIAFLSTYPPSECGIATFTENLITTIDHIEIINTHVIAIRNSDNCIYSDKVMGEINRNEKSDYIEMAKTLNASNVDLLVIEHEYGIYGGNHGDYILDLVNNLEIPIVTTIHTILSEPNAKQRQIIHELGKKSEKIITMARNTKLMLRSIYGIETEKIEVIHHGVPKKPLQNRQILKKKLGYENQHIIISFGFIGPKKGLEYGIEAIDKVIHSYTDSDILYLILGQTPDELKEEGIAYRKKLEDLVDTLDLSRNVKFINKYLSKDEIIQYLQLADICLTPYVEKDQAVSGTLAYAVGYGKAIVSTPYLYAQEMLADGHGLFAEFNDPDSLAGCIKDIIDHPIKKLKMERNISKIGRTMYWDKIALRYTKVLLSIITSVTGIGAV